MAKRYISYENLSAGYYKPADTLGSHHCMVVVKNKETVVTGSADGRSVTLKKGETLGYDQGTVWVVPNPDTYRDPIRRVLAKARLGQKLLMYSTQPVEYTESFQHPCRGL